MWILDGSGLTLGYINADTLPFGLVGNEQNANQRIFFNLGEILRKYDYIVNMVINALILKPAAESKSIKPGNLLWIAQIKTI